MLTKAEARNQQFETILVERTHHSTDLYESAFGDIVEYAHTIVDLGAGDSPFADDYTVRGKEVHRVDPQYATEPPKNPDGALPYFASDIPLPTGTADVAVSAFMFQHLPKEEISDTVIEALRVVRQVKDQDRRGDAVNGTLAIFPVYAPKRLSGALKKSGVDWYAGVGYWDEANLAERGLHYPTLVIRNVDSLHEKDAEGRAPLDDLIEALESTEALYDKSVKGEIGKRARRLVMRYRGHTRFDT